MKMYGLHIHGKQGDDLQERVNKGGDASSAFYLWSMHFEDCAAACSRISEVLEGKKVKIDGQNNIIFLTPLDEVAEVALEALVVCKFLYVFDDMEEDEDENTPSEDNAS